jgi:hypothetical protein
MKAKVTEILIILVNISWAWTIPEAGQTGVPPGPVVGHWARTGEELTVIKREVRTKKPVSNHERNFVSISKR